MKPYFLFLVALCTTTTWLSAQNNPQYAFILDASGSMWQKLDNEFKIAVAKTVMKDLGSC